MTHQSRNGRAGCTPRSRRSKFTVNGCSKPPAGLHPSPFAGHPTALPVRRLTSSSSCAPWPLPTCIEVEPRRRRPLRRRAEPRRRRPQLHILQCIKMAAPSPPKRQASTVASSPPRGQATAGRPHPSLCAGVRVCPQAWDTRGLRAQARLRARGGSRERARARDYACGHGSVQVVSTDVLPVAIYNSLSNARRKIGSLVG
ncbi:unnamed protein product [Urochloa humidicola]